MRWNIFCQVGDHILECIFMKENIFAFSFNEVCSKGTNEQHVNIGLDYGSVQNKLQAINWTYYVWAQWCVYAPGL